MLTLAAALTIREPATGEAACTASASGLAFGLYNPSAMAPTDFTGTVTIACSAGSGAGPYNIALTIGGGGSYATRRMSSGGVYAPYQLYADAARSITWGDGSGGSATVPSVDDIASTGGTSTYTVFGRMAAAMTIDPLTYTDTIIVTVTY
jgi:spore coat protein U-like protein